MDRLRPPSSKGFSPPDVVREAGLGRTMRAAYRARKNVGDEEIVKARELIEASFANGQSPTSSARRVIALMLAHAAERAGEDNTEFCIPRASLKGANKGNSRLQDVLDEVSRTLIRVRWSYEKDQTGEAAQGVATVPLLSYRWEQDGDDDDARIRYAFSPIAAYVMRRSSVFGALNRAVLLNFESRYAITLFELGSLKLGQQFPTWEGSVEDLRALIGVPAKSYRDWANLKRATLDAAASELAQLAHFTMQVQATAVQGRRISRVRLIFHRKEEEAMAAARRELEASKVGRRARRKGTVEAIVEPAAVVPPEIQQELSRMKAGLPSTRSDLPQLPLPGASVDDAFWEDLRRQFAEKGAAVVVSDDDVPGRIKRQRRGKAG